MKDTSKEGKKELIIILLILLVAWGICSFKEAKDRDDIARDYSTNTCIVVGCSKPRAYGSYYCNEHEPKTKDAYRNSSSSSSSSDTGSSNSGSSKSSGSNSGRSSSGSSSSTTTYNTLWNDPADYDDPEEYADDAYGEDFDDWDDAYDYWEDY